MDDTRPTNPIALFHWLFPRNRSNPGERYIFETGTAPYNAKSSDTYFIYRKFDYSLEEAHRIGGLFVGNEDITHLDLPFLINVYETGCNTILYLETWCQNINFQGGSKLDNAKQFYEAMPSSPRFNMFGFLVPIKRWFQHVKTTDLKLHQGPKRAYYTMLNKQS
jgi:hypothetical protein